MTVSTDARPVRRGLAALALLAVTGSAGCSGEGSGAAATTRSATGRTPPVVDQIRPSGDVPGLRGAGQRIAVLDSGLSGDFLRSCGGCRATVAGGAPLDEVGHGTTMTAIITGTGKDAYPGLAPAASVTVFALSPKQGQTVAPAALVTAFDTAVSQGFDIINVSIGSQTPDERLAASVRDALDRGITVVAAAGPDPTDLRLYPAAFPGVLAAAGHAHERTGSDQHRHPDEAGAAAPLFAVIDVPFERLTLPEFDPVSGTTHLRTAESSSDATALLSGLVAVHRAASATCTPAPSLSEFLAQVHENADEGSALLAGTFDSCDER